VNKASSLEASLAEMRVPLDHVRSARRCLSFIWCSIVAAVSLLVVLNLAAAAFRHFFVAIGPRRGLNEPPPTPTPPSDSVIASADRDVPPSAAAAPTISRERRERRWRAPCSHHAALQSLPSSSSAVDRGPASHDRRPHLPGCEAASATRPMPLRSPNITQQFAMHVDEIYYTDGVVESNV